MTYTIGEISKMTGIAVHTLRFYDKEGLFNDIERTSGGIRKFSDEELTTINWINCLKSTGMNLKDIKRYLDMVKHGDSTLKERLEVFKQREQAVKAQIDELNRTMAMIQHKKWWYETSIELGSEKAVRKIKHEDYSKAVYDNMLYAYEIFNKK